MQCKRGQSAQQQLAPLSLLHLLSFTTPPRSVTTSPGADEALWGPFHATGPSHFGDYLKCVRKSCADLLHWKHWITRIFWREVIFRSRWSLLNFTECHLSDVCNRIYSESIVSLFSSEFGLHIKAKTFVQGVRRSITLLQFFCHICVQKLCHNVKCLHFFTFNIDYVWVSE